MRPHPIGWITITLPVVAPEYHRNLARHHDWETIVRVLAALGVALLLAPVAAPPVMAQWCDEAVGGTERYCPLDQQPPTTVAGGIRVEFRSLDMRDAQVGTLGIQLTNLGDDSILLGIDILARVGGWFRRADVQRQYQFGLAPGASTAADLEILIPGYSLDGSVRIRLGPATGVAPHTRLAEVLLDRTYDLGRSPSALERMATFAQRSDQHLTVFVRRGFGLEQQLPRIVGERESALAAVATFIGVPPRSGIRVVIYPNQSLKWLDTGHMGAGWAFDSTIVEVVGNELDPGPDPFHELTHILADPMGSPPDLFSEGLAVYVAERLGGDALAVLNNPGRTVSEVVCEIEATGELIPFDDLLRLEIGSEASRPIVSYPQSASVVGYFIEQFGMDLFRSVYSALRFDDGPEPHAANRRAFQDVSGVSLLSFESAWRSHVRDECGIRSSESPD